MISQKILSKIQEDNKIEFVSFVFKNRSRQIYCKKEDIILDEEHGVLYLKDPFALLDNFDIMGYIFKDLDDKFDIVKKHIEKYVSKHNSAVMSLKASTHRFSEIEFLYVERNFDMPKENYFYILEDVKEKFSKIFKSPDKEDKEEVEEVKENKKSWWKFWR